MNSVQCSEINTQESNCQAYGQNMFSFIRNCQTAFQSGLLSFIKSIFIVRKSENTDKYYDILVQFYSIYVNILVTTVTIETMLSSFPFTLSILTVDSSPLSS